MPKPKVICFDICDTLVHNDILANAMMSAGYDYFDPNTHIEFDHSKMDIPIEVATAAFTGYNNPELMGAMIPTESAVDTVMHFHEVGDITVSVTSRHRDKVKTSTDAMISRWFPQIKNIVYTSGKSKQEYFESLDVDVVFDDSPEAIVDAINAGVPEIYYVSNEQTRHNHEAVFQFVKNGGHPSVKVIRRLKDHLKYSK